MDDNFDEVGDGDDGEKGEVGPPEELGLPADCAQGREETCGRNYSHKSALSLLVDIVIIAAKDLHLALRRNKADVVENILGLFSSLEMGLNSWISRSFLMYF